MTINEIATTVGLSSLVSAIVGHFLTLKSQKQNLISTASRATLAETVHLIKDRWDDIVELDGLAYAEFEERLAKYQGPEEVISLELPKQFMKTIMPLLSNPAISGATCFAFEDYMKSVVYIMDSVASRYKEGATLSSVEFLHRIQNQPLIILGDELRGQLGVERAHQQGANLMGSIQPSISSLVNSQEDLRTHIRCLKSLSVDEFNELISETKLAMRTDNLGASR